MTYGAGVATHGALVTTHGADVTTYRADARGVAKELGAGWWWRQSWP